MRRAAILSLLLVAACDAPAPAVPPGEAPPPPQSAIPFAPAAEPEPAPRTPKAPEAGTDDWRKVATEADRDRLARMDAAWREALADARPKHAAELAALGPAADPAAGGRGAPPSPGVYRCRTIKLGSPGEPGPHSLGYVAYPAFRCRVDLSAGGDLTLAKQTGSQRSTGQLFPERDERGEDTGRYVFLGAQAWGSDEPSAPGYGENAERDQIGLVERLGPDRYRLVMPWPRQESVLDVMILERVGN